MREPALRAPARAAANCPCGEAEAYDRLGFAAHCGDPGPRRRRRAGCERTRVRNAVGHSGSRLEAGRRTRSSSRPPARPCARACISFRPDKGPTLPAELGDPTAPEPLRAVAIGAWYAAEDPAFLLEALQHVAPDAGSSRPARLLDSRFHRGQAPLASALEWAGRGGGPWRSRSGHDAWASPSTR